MLCFCQQGTQAWRKTKSECYVFYVFNREAKFVTKLSNLFELKMNRMKIWLF